MTLREALLKVLELETEEKIEAFLQMAEIFAMVADISLKQSIITLIMQKR